MGAWFENPEWLWLLLALIPLAIWDGWRRWGTVRSRQIASVVLRTLVLSAMVVAVARPRFAVTEEVATVVFVVDRSASVPDPLLTGAIDRVERMWNELERDERGALVFFDRSPDVAVPPDHEFTRPPILRGTAVDETDIGTALQVALGLIPEQHAGRIVLFTDGRATQGAVRGPVNRARARGIPIYTVPLDPGFADPAVADVELERRSVRPGESIEGTIALRGGPEDVTGRLVVRMGDAVVLDESIDVPAGATLDVPFTHELEPELEPGMATLDVTFEPAPGSADLHAHNNSRTIGFNIAEPPKIVIIANDPQEVTQLRDLLVAERMEVVVEPVATMNEASFAGHDGPGWGLEDIDLVVLANAPARPTEEGEAAIPDSFLEELRRYVSSGGGLIVLGGDRSYELGGYGETALARVLPIELTPRDPEVEPAVTMVIILDNSGSMGTYAEGGTKMDLADAAAVAAMQLLRSFDQIGVMAVDDRVDWVVPLQAVTDRVNIERRIRGIAAGGGGIYVYTSLREAYRTMRRVDTPLRHVILFSDAADSEEQVAGVIFGWGPGPNSYDLARSMRAEGITVSVIGIGYDYDQDTSFLRQLAEHGGGRFYMTSNATELQALFVEETQRLVDSVLNEEPFRVRAPGEHPSIEGIEFRRSPRISGYIELEARPTAEVVLEHPDGHPIMATWQYGLGMVAALAIDAGPRWAAEWLTWDGYALFHTQLSRWAMRRHEGDETAIEVAFEQGNGTVRIARRTREGLTEVEGGLVAEIVQTDAAGQPLGRPQALPLTILEPGLWEAGLVTEPGRRYHIQVVDRDGEAFAEQSFVSPPSAEFRYEGADQLSLVEIAERTGASFAPREDDLPGELRVLTSYQPLWLYFVCGALLLMPFDAFLRRSGRDA